MNKKKLGIVSASLALALALAVPVVGSFSNFETNASSRVEVATTNFTETNKDLKVTTLKAMPEGPDVFYNTLATIQSTTYNYVDIKDKTIILWYKSNNAIEGFKKMKMKIDEYELDGVTPKTVSFSSDIAAVQNSHIPYAIYALEDKYVDYIDNLNSYLSDKECQKKVLERGCLETDYLNTGATPNPKNSQVTLTSETLDYKLFRDGVIRTEVTYSINGEDDETVYAFIHLRRDLNNQTIGNKTVAVNVHANVGDVIEYKVRIPGKNGDYYQNFKATVVE